MCPMRLSAALVPPPDVLGDLNALLDSVGRDAREIDFVAADTMHITLTKFGHVAHRDAVAVSGRLAKEAMDWPPITVRFAGCGALEWPGDDSVWAQLEGDLDELRGLARAIPEIVRPMGFLVDRRTFRTWLRIGRITDLTTPVYLQQLVDAVDAYRGPEWTIDAFLMLGVRGTAVEAVEEGLPVFERIALQGGR